MTDKKNGVNFIQAEKNNVSTKGWFGLDNITAATGKVIQIPQKLEKVQF